MSFGWLAQPVNHPGPRQPVVGTSPGGSGVGESAYVDKQGAEDLLPLAKSLGSKPGSEVLGGQAISEAGHAVVTLVVEIGYARPPEVLQSSGRCRWSLDGSA